MADDVDGLTVKDLLLEVRSDVKAMSAQLAVLGSQDLDNRVNRLEQWRDRADGRMSILTAGVAIIGGCLGILTAILTVLRFISG
jgi:hypothetical protein